MNQEISAENKKRVSKGKKEICSEVSDEAKRAILREVAYVTENIEVDFYNVKNLKAGRFIEDIAAHLSCFEHPCRGRESSIAGAICNSGAYKGDLGLVGEAMNKVFEFDLFRSRTLGYNVVRKIKKYQN